MKQMLISATFATALAAFFTGCASETTGPSESGSVGVNLIVGNTDVTAVSFEVVCDSGIALNGQFNVRDEEPNVWAAIMDLPPGDCTITMVALDDAGATLCTGSQDFTVLVDLTIKVDVVLVCVVDGDDPLGDIDIDATFEIVEGNNCPRLHFLNAVPDEVPAEGSEVTVWVSDKDDDALTTELTATGGSFLQPNSVLTNTADPVSVLTTYSCDGARGAQTISVTVTDGDTACDKTKSFEVECGGASLVCEYVQDFEALDPADPGALANDGWLYFNSVFDSTGAFKFQFGPFPAPTTAGQISLIASGEGGPDQGNNQLVVFSNYDCCDPQGHFNGTDLVFTAVFQQIDSVLPTDIGRSFTFQFDAKRGNIEGASSAQAFIRTLDPDAGFTITSNVELDVTDLPVDWGTYSITLDLTDPRLEGQILQFGFKNFASNFEGSGIFYDNITFGPQDCAGECAVDADCPDDGNECTVAVCSAGRCEISNVVDGTACNNNTGTCSAGVCQPTGPIVCEYAQDFEALDQASLNALSDDGWEIFGQVFDGSGAFRFGYGPFPAPNAAADPGRTFFSAVVTGEGGMPQGAQQLSVFSDYNCCQPNFGHFTGTDRVEVFVFQEPRPAIDPIAAGDIGRTVTFSFDAKRGNINEFGGNSTALAYINTLDPNDDFAQTSIVTIDTTDLPATWARYEISLELTDPLLEGQILQFGFQNTASNFEDSGNFYDNITFGPQDCAGECAVDADCPDDGNECTAAVCSAGSCETSNAADGTACNNNTGTCNAGVCQPTGPIALRPLPEIYTTGTAINYGPYRAGGPGTGEMPTDAQILEDLDLLQTAGYNLIRLFGGDAVSEKILQLAEANYPEMRFQQGLFLEGLSGDAATNCDSVINDSQVETVIRLANTYPSVVTVSVGNETSFSTPPVPLRCLEGYITRTRGNVTQPVTADDDFTFYVNFFGRSPDGVLRLIDFVSIHTYPFTTSQFGLWDWRQVEVPAGPLRAEAMMNASLAEAQQNYQWVFNYPYLDASGTSVTIGESRPIVIGETGWKWRETNFNQEIEFYAANPVNAKWYFDLMRSWERSPGGPPTIFIFSAFDEEWKQEFLDDGWGFWDELRMPNYVLCGTPVPGAPPCNDPVYEDAGFFVLTP